MDEIMFCKTIIVTIKTVMQSFKNKPIIISPWF